MKYEYQSRQKLAMQQIQNKRADFRLRPSSLLLENSFYRIMGRGIEPVNPPIGLQIGR